jgi:hypothetical protein
MEYSLQQVNNEFKKLSIEEKVDDIKRRIRKFQAECSKPIHRGNPVQPQKVSEMDLLRAKLLPPK